MDYCQNLLDSYLKKNEIGQFIKKKISCIPKTFETPRKYTHFPKLVFPNIRNFIDEDLEDTQLLCSSSLCCVNFQVLSTNLSKWGLGGWQNQPSTSRYSAPLKGSHHWTSVFQKESSHAMLKCQSNVTISSSQTQDDNPLEQRPSECSKSLSLSIGNKDSRTENDLQFIIDENISFGSPAHSTLRLSIDSSSQCDFCRICHDSDREESLISPCKCKGTLSLVHASCLQHWLAESDSSNCELCGFKFQTIRKPKYSLIGSMITWFQVCTRQRRELILDVLATFSFAPMAGIGTYIGLLTAEALNIDEEIPNLTLGTLFARVGAFSVISLMTTIDVAYATWATLRLQYHINSWYAWYRRNCEVTVLPLNQQNQ